MAKPIFMYDDKLRTAVLTASSFLELLAPSLLQNYNLHVGWRAVPGVEDVTLFADLGASTTIGVMALLEFNGNPGASFRVRMSNSDPTAGTGEVYDSGTLTGAFDPLFRHFVHLLPAPAAARYLRLDISQPSAEFIQAGGWVAGPTWQTSCSYKHGFSLGAEDADTITVTLGGSEWVTEGFSRRRFRGEWPRLTKAEVDTHGAFITQVVGRRLPILLIKDPAGDNLGLETIFGRLQDQPTFPEAFHLHYSWQVDIAELV
jgi:hypothetical protein